MVGWAAVLFGLFGILLIVQPGSGLEPVGVACARAAVGANVGYQLLSRMLAASERTLPMLFYTALVGTVLFGAIVPWLWSDRTPTPIEIALLASLGAYGGLGHFLFGR